MIRRITQQHLEAAGKEPVYKVVRVEESGRLRSLWVDGTKEHPTSIPLVGHRCEAVALTYKPDRVIGDGKYGIWCNTTLNGARHQAGNNGARELCQIYEAYPIGEAIQIPYGWSDVHTVLYPAVIMGKQAIETIDLREGS